MITQPFDRVDEFPLQVDSVTLKKFGYRNSRFVEFL